MLLDLEGKSLKLVRLIPTLLLAHLLGHDHSNISSPRDGHAPSTEYEADLLPLKGILEGVAARQAGMPDIVHALLQDCLLHGQREQLLTSPCQQYWCKAMPEALK